MNNYLLEKLMAASFILAVLIAALMLCVFSPESRAAMTIEICGASNYQCKEPDKIGTPSWQGGIIGKCDTIDADCQVKPQQVTVNPKTPLETPPGWTAPVSPSVEPTPPSTTTKVSGPTQPHPNAGYPGQAMPSPPSAHCTGGTNVVYWDNSVTNQYRIYARHTFSGFPSILSGSDQVAICGDGTYVSQKALACPSGTSYQHPETCAAAPVCPPGYNDNGTTCTLTNPNLVMKPANGTCTIKRDGNSFSGDPRDPDCQVNPGVVVTGDSVTMSPKTGSSENTRVKFEPAGNGSITITTPNPDGTTTQRTVTFGPPNSTTGEVATTGTSTKTFSGTGDQTSGTPIGELPTDYNREMTQQQIKNLLDQIKGNTDTSGAPNGTGATTAAESALDAANQDRMTKLGDVASATGKDTSWGFSLDMPVGIDCEPFVWQNVGTIDICQSVPILKQIVAWCWYITTAFLCIGMVGRTLSGGT